MEGVPALAKEKGIRKVVALKVAGAYHSRLMAAAATGLAPFLTNAEMHAPRVPVVANYTADVTDGDLVAVMGAGDVDAIEGVPSSDLASVRQNPALVFAQKVSARLVYLYLDSGREDTPQVTARDGSKLPKNPLADERVRRALSRAINRAAIAGGLMAGLGYPTGNVVPLPVPPYDPEAARKLLTEAGYPDGVAITITASRSPSMAPTTAAPTTAW